MKLTLRIFLLILLCSLQSLAQVNLTKLGHIDYAPETVAGVWHYVDSTGHEYALVGASNRVSIVDVSNPSNPFEVQSVPALAGESSLWRELKTAGNFAYAGSEGGGGIIVIDLSNLPGPVTSYHWYGDGAIAGQLQTSHTIAVTDGYLYVFGCQQLANGGVVIASLADPYHPTYVGQYNQNYVHDGYVRNDTLWAGEIYAGQFSIVDVTNKANPVLLATQQTPGQFCHNTWLSDNSKYLFTTDELNNVPLGSFDITDLSNIKLLTTYFTDSMPNEEVHNVRVLNDYLINPSYGSQLVICDASRPDNIVEVANYQTGGFLDWDASPYYPSGIIVSTDTYGGFDVFQPNYIRGCYLEGNVTDSITTNVLNGVTVNITSLNKTISTNLVGDYKTGTVHSGLYDVEFSKAGYLTKKIQNVLFTNGQLTQLDVQLVPFNVTGFVTESSTGNPIANATVYIYNSTSQVTVNTDVNGAYSVGGILSGTYEVTASKWGYVSSCQTTLLDGANPVNFSLANGYYDDFTSDNNWTVISTAITGAWTRVIPAGTLFVGVQSNPNVDALNDCGNEAFVTGNIVGTSPNTDDVDNGYTQLISPSLDLSTYANPYISYSRWFFIQNGVPPANIDTLYIKLTDGVNVVTVDYATAGSIGNSSWVQNSIRVADYLPPSNNMKLIITIEDKNGSGNIVEAGFDHFYVTDAVGVDEIQNTNTFSCSPNPYSNIVSITIKGNNISDYKSYQVTDISGKIILSNSIASAKFEINGSDQLSAGLYFVTVNKTDGTFETIKVVKSK
ncbi:MAG TPA: choice-of-anchor B family protein [Bacteroidia bacterium]|nr:choice-of-anchor B family protein [Bacteroidia bacterium]